MANKETPKQCLICGDKAYVFNFGVISCQSCKAFFRRNALKNKGFECAFDSNCQVDVITRKFCQKCRLDKCFRLGMKKEWILNEDELKTMRTKIMENKVKRRNRELYKRQMVSKTADDLIAETPIPDTKYGLVGDSSSSNSSDSGKGNSDSSDSDTKNDTQIIHLNGMKVSKFNTDVIDIYNNYHRGKGAEFLSSVVAITQHVTDYNKSFNTYECDKLIELFSAINFIREPTLPLEPVVTDMMNFKMAMVFKLDKEIRNFITVAQNVAEFDSLCENDRIALVKYGSVEIISMRMIQFYNVAAQSWTIFVDKNNWIVSRMDMLKSEPIKAIFRNSFGKIGNEWDSDPIILDLLTIILLFDPNRPNLLHREVIKLQQNIYMHLLQRYLLLKYRSEYKAKTKFLNLMNALTDINIMGEIFMKKCYQTRPELLGPLLKEIFDIQDIQC
ncbi:unnamed protein product [Oppiella nova]|uniref:Uncharacterized protein n=1 Tax=Oppiella nova TaxID=334625 RepID=A0A7R9QPE5_9ACAR|nr:unnamed protein product [Oppiella nova]CAG2170573.1 unnamed protein product [Oppiella nova]